ncbi:MAG: type II toxin-antitoxin system VapC family toxin [Candidatus Rokubacteria bacterium]|nr:type II toxin-antitoxin system VapC family toxin [Candidatus Rokubacteria bacterium]
MSHYVVDASVAVKWFVPEVHTGASLRLLDGSHELLAPDLLLPEFGNILWKKVRLGEITHEDGRDILRGLMAVPLDLYSSRDLFEPAFEIANGINRSVYDSLYVALALRQDCQMVTADRRFHAALEASPLAANLRWVEDEL